MYLWDALYSSGNGDQNQRCLEPPHEKKSYRSLSHIYVQVLQIVDNQDPCLLQEH